MRFVPIVADFTARRVCLDLFPFFSPLPKIFLLAMFFLAASDGGFECFKDVLKLPKECGEIRSANHDIDLRLVSK